MVGVAHAQTPVVLYDKTLDQITIKATDTALKVLAEELFKATGIDARVDGTISDTKISIHIESQPLKQGLKRVFKGYNHAIKYRKRGNQHQVTSILILPAGSTSDTPSHHRASAVPTEYHGEDGMVPDHPQVAEAAKDNPATRRIRYLDDLTPWEQSQLAEEERLALPVRPPARPVPEKLPNTCAECAKDGPASERESDTDE